VYRRGRENLSRKGVQELKRAQALERTNEREKRSAKEQIAVLDKRLGKDIGAESERTRLSKLKVG